MSNVPTSDRSELIAALMSPGCYPHSVDEVRLAQTHISWVLLAGEYAYKIKKPVKFPFVDFSTLARRRHYCFRELQLNRRFAPALYLDVVSIRGSSQAPTIGGRGAAIEYAVRMRRFAPEDELERLLARDAVSTDDLASLGSRLADIHEGCAVFTDRVSPAETFRVLCENAEQLRHAWRSRSDELRRAVDWMVRQRPQVSPIIDRRRAAGRVRECHGDLHAGNIVRLDDELVAFDCLEFDPALSRVDVMNDVAFLAMDLSARGRPTLAYAFLNAWLERGGDYDGLSLLRLFAVHYALVRAKVAVLGKDERSAHMYIDTADRNLQQRKPRLLITAGLSGSGKTWLSGQLMTQFAAIRLRSDIERKRMAGLRADQSSRSLADEGIYAREFNEQVYARLLHSAESLLLAQYDVIVDAAFLKSAERLKFVDLAHRLQVPIVIVHCTAADEELRSRLRARQRAGRDASEATVDILERQVNRWEPFTEQERGVVMTVRTDDPHAVQEAIAGLRRSGELIDI